MGGVRFDESNVHVNNTLNDEVKGSGDKLAIPFHPTLSLSTVPKDLTTGCAGNKLHPAILNLDMLLFFFDVDVPLVLCRWIW